MASSSLIRNLEWPAWLPYGRNSLLPACIAALIGGIIVSGPLSAEGDGRAAPTVADAMAAAADLKVAADTVWTLSKAFIVIENG